jgi:V8-like Glu-specific endopeptidase
VTFSGTVATENESLVLIQHPAGEFKQVSIADCRVAGVSRTGVAAAGTDFGHLCDSLGGSSGSPVVDGQTGRVVGLHHWGFEEGAANPVNQAVHIGLVLDDLRTRLPALHAEITGSPP